MDMKKKPSFIERMKEAVGQKGKPSNGTFTEEEIRSVLVKAKLCLGNRLSAASMQLQLEATKLNGYLEIMESDEQQIVQELAEKVVEVRALKLMTLLLKKLQNSATKLVEARGSVENLTDELLWLQNILWVRREKNIESLEELWQFSRRYFRGVDIAEDSTIWGRLYPEIRQLTLKPKEISLDAISADLQPVLNFASSYPLERKMRMINLNRQNIEVLRAMMDEQRIVNQMSTPGSSIRLMEPESPVSFIKVESGTPSGISYSPPQVPSHPVKVPPNQVYCQSLQKEFPGVHPDEIFSLGLLRSCFKGEPTRFPQKLRVKPFEG